MKNFFKDRYVILSLLFLVFGAVIIIQLIDLQIIRGEQFDASSRYVAMKDRTIPAPRGRIFDRNGVPIATNQESYMIYIANSGLDAIQLNEMLLRLALVMEKNGDSVLGSIQEYLTIHPISFNQKKTIKQVLNWEKDKELFAMSKDQLTEDPETLFRFLRKEVFEIDPKYSDEEAFKIMTLRYEIKKSQWSFDTGRAICIAKDVSVYTIAEVEEKSHLFSGVFTDMEPVREYVDSKWAAHVLGYIGTMNEKEYAEYKTQGYKMNDLIGKNGIELFAEKYLRGTDGTKKVDLTSSTLTDGIYGDQAIPGHDVVLTIDMKLQKAAMESLEREINLIRSKKDDKKNNGDANAGAAVAINVKTGEVLAIASYPAFDPLDFLHSNLPESSTRIKQWSQDNDNTPMYNRAIKGTYAPGSTYKPITAIAAIEEGVMKPDVKILDRGFLEVPGNRIFKCLEYPRTGHGWLDLEKALATSCNIYFYTIGLETTIDKIDKWASYFGFGRETGIDLLGEKRGIRANKDSKEQIYKDRVDQIWRPANTAMASIGQDDNAFTPLQIANYISTLANGGYRYKPYLIKQVVKHDGSIINQAQPEYEKVPVKESTIEAVKKGMVAVNNSSDGTAQSVFRDFPKSIVVAGKTGTPETGRERFGESSNGVYVCYAPADDPQIAVAVVIEKGVWGAYAAPVAKDILSEYFGFHKVSEAVEVIEPEIPVFTR